MTTVSAPDAALALRPLNVSPSFAFTERPPGRIRRTVLVVSSYMRSENATFTRVRVDARCVPGRGERLLTDGGVVSVETRALIFCESRFQSQSWSWREY